MTVRCDVCVTVRICGAAPIFYFCLSGMIFHPWRASLSVFPTMFLVTALVTGWQGRWIVFPLVVHFHWWKFPGLCTYVSFFGSLVHACFNELGNRTRTRELQTCERAAVKCVFERCWLSSAVGVPIKYFVQRSLLGHFCMFHSYKRVGDIFQAIPLFDRKILCNS